MISNFSNCYDFFFDQSRPRTALTYTRRNATLSNTFHQHAWPPYVTASALTLSQKRKSLLQVLFSSKLRAKGNATRESKPALTVNLTLNRKSNLKKLI